MSRIFSTAALVTIAAGALSVAAAAEQLQEVTVQAARAVETPAGRTSSGIPIVDASISYGVSYADLDLTLPSGVKTMQKRVSDAAMKACTQLRHLYPVTANPAPSDAECAKSAADKAMAQVSQLASAAHK